MLVCSHIPRSYEYPRFPHSVCMCVCLKETGAVYCFLLEDHGLLFQFLSSGNYHREDIMLFLEQLTFVSPLGSEQSHMTLNMTMTQYY